MKLSRPSFVEQLERLAYNYCEKKFLLAVSGGVDSMVLLWLMHELKLPLEVAHVNYGLRGKDSDKDCELVQRFCAERSIPFHLYKCTAADKKPDGSIQLWARELRYNFFFKLLEDRKLDLIVTAHHLNDQLETFLINLSKASGIKGLSGIPSNKNRILRPLLSFSKEEIYRFARAEQIPFREDVSNQKSDYLRNKIRNEIIPKLEELNAAFIENFRKSQAYLSEASDFMLDQVDKLRQDLTISENENEITLDREKLAGAHPFARYHLLDSFGLHNREEQQKIFTAASGSFFYSDKWQMEVRRNTLIFKAKSLPTQADEIILEATDRIDLRDLIFPSANKTWEVDFAKVALPLRLRSRRSGDRIFPVGMNGSKTVSKFFKDEKIPILARYSPKILADATGKVLGVVPYRQDRRSLPDDKTINKIYILL